MNKMIKKSNLKMLKEKKLFFILSFLYVVVLMNFVSADSCYVDTSTNCLSNEHYMVMKISGATNAHGALVNQNNFPGNYVLCCDFPGTSQCNGENKILGLYSSTNSHAEKPERNAYQQDVCYTGLENIWSAQEANPAEDEIEILTLSSLTNAHLGITNYPIKILGIPIEADDGEGEECRITNARWGSRFVPVGNSVSLSAEGNAQCTNEQVSFRVVNDGNERETYNAGNSQFSNRRAETTWRTRLSGNSPHAKYFFIASIGDRVRDSGREEERLLYVYRPDLIINCRDYREEAICIADPDNVASETVEGFANVDCDDPERNCRCAWDNNREPKCFGAYDIFEGGDGDDREQVGSCVFLPTQIISSCEGDEEFMRVIIRTEWLWVDSCYNDEDCRRRNLFRESECESQSGERTIECPAYVLLPFFNAYNFVGAILIIGIVYGVFMFRKKRI